MKARSRRQSARSAESTDQDSLSRPKTSRVWADEHKIGVAQGVDAEVLEGLQALTSPANAPKSECILRCPARPTGKAIRRVAEAYKRIAYEEADHASKFAELLGEVVYPDTKKNLEVRIEAEFGATKGKKDIATRAKQLGYDAIHDTVHEMCKDEARHGRAFEGLLNRYFK
jgi:hypothetical protein